MMTNKRNREANHFMAIRNQAYNTVSICTPRIRYLCLRQLGRHGIPGLLVPSALRHRLPPGPLPSLRRLCVGRHARRPGRLHGNVALHQPPRSTQLIVQCL